MYDNFILYIIGQRVKARSRRRIDVPFKCTQLMASARDDRIERQAYPDDVDEPFFRELQYIEHGDRIKGTPLAAMD